MQSVAKSSEEYLRLLTYIEQQADGVLLTYNTVHADVGIPMTLANKNKLRRAILRSGREYAVVPKVGYQLADGETAMPILVHHMAGIDNKVSRTERAHRVIERRHYDQLTPEQQAGVRFLGSVFGAIRLAAENGKKLYGKPRPALSGGEGFIEIST